MKVTCNVKCKSLESPGNCKLEKKKGGGRREGGGGRKFERILKGLLGRLSDEQAKTP